MNITLDAPDKRFELTRRRLCLLKQTEKMPLLGLRREVFEPCLVLVSIDSIAKSELL